MKLKNSFLIVAGVFFFAVAFINFAKAGDDGGGNEGETQTYQDKSGKMVYCLYILYYYDHPNHGPGVWQANTLEDIPDGGQLIKADHGYRIECIDNEGETCTTRSCSSAWD